MTRTLVAGIGNIFLGDDGFGVEVATRLAAAGPPPDGVTVAEYGIRGVHLAYELLDGYDVLVLVDALPMGEAPGTLAVIEAEPVPTPADPAAAPVVDAHSMSPAAVLTALAGLGARCAGSSSSGASRPPSRRATSSARRTSPRSPRAS